MKKLLYFLTLLCVALLLQFCNSTKKAAKSTPPPPPPPPVEVVVVKPEDPKVVNTVSYVKDIAPIMKASCSPCHFPADGGKMFSLSTFAEVKTRVKGILRTVQLPKEMHEFMPFQSKKTPLTVEQINTLKAWQKEGMAE